MSEDQLRRIFAEGRPDWGEEYTKTGLDAQEIVSVLDTQTFFELLKLPYPTDQTGVIDRLERAGLIDTKNGRYSIRRIGALLLAKRLEDFPELARKAPRVVVYTGTNKLDARLDQVGIKGYAVGFQGLVRFVMGQLPQNEVIKDARRAEVKLVPELAIRELVANALIHQDLTTTGASVMIDIYLNRLEISNPRVLSTLCTEMGHVRAHDKPESSRTLSVAGKQERNSFTDYIGDDGGRRNQAG
jgi:predicted HTH transcriptional regulator